MSGLDASLGVKAEEDYATAVTVDRFYEQEKNPLAGKYERIESTAVRKGSRMLRADRWAPNPKGASGSIPLEILSKTFGFWFLQALGHVEVATLTDADEGAFVQVFTPASTTGLSFTAQVGKPDSTDEVHAFTYAGCKVTDFTIASDVDAITTIEVGVDAAKETVGGSGVFALAEPDYSALDDSELMTYVSGAITIGGDTVEVSTISVKVDNGLNVDRWKQGATKREPVTDSQPTVTFELDMEFDNLDQNARVTAALAAGAMAEIIVSWKAPTLIPGTTRFPELIVTIQGRFDDDGLSIDGPKMIESKLVGIGVETDDLPAIKLEYTTDSVTP